MKQVYLLTGGPGSGKTTIIKEVASSLGWRAGGFYTEEIRAGGLRQGFKLITLDGQSTVLSRIDIRSPYRVSKYGIDIQALEQVGIPALREAINIREVIIIDEIGKMELYSSAFREAVLEALASGKYTLGTIMLSPHPWADEIKRRPEVRLLTITRANHQEVLAEVRQWLPR